MAIFQFLLEMASQRKERPLRVLTPSFSHLPKAALETTPMMVWLNLHHSRSRRVGRRPLPFCATLSFKQGSLCRSGLSFLRKCFEHPSTSALPGKTTYDVCCACQSICLFILSDSSMPGQQTHSDLCSGRLCMAVVGTCGCDSCCKMASQLREADSARLLCWNSSIAMEADSNLSDTLETSYIFRS